MNDFVRYANFLILLTNSIFILHWPKKDKDFRWNKRTFFSEIVTITNNLLCLEVLWEYAHIRSKWQNPLFYYNNILYRNQEHYVTICLNDYWYQTNIGSAQLLIVHACLESKLLIWFYQMGYNIQLKEERRVKTVVGSIYVVVWYQNVEIGRGKKEEWKGELFSRVLVSVTIVRGRIWLVKR